MRKKTMELLVKLGVPVEIKGFHYICDAMEIYEQDESYVTTKTCCLYEKVADKNAVYPSQVERCMRHAFERAVRSGRIDLLGKYRTADQKPTNKNLLASLYLTLKEM